MGGSSVGVQLGGQMPTSLLIKTFEKIIGSSNLLD